MQLRIDVNSASIDFPLLGVPSCPPEIGPNKSREVIIDILPLAHIKVETLPSYLQTFNHLHMKRKEKIIAYLIILQKSSSIVALIVVFAFIFQKYPFVTKNSRFYAFVMTSSLMV